MQEMNPNELTAILNDGFDGIISVNREGVITFFNTVVENLIGLRSEDALGKKIKAILPWIKITDVFKRGEAFIEQQKVGNKCIAVKYLPLKDRQQQINGAVVVLRDLTEMCNLREENTNLKDIQIMLEAIINATQDAISVVDEEGRGLLVNPAYTKLIGLTAEDVIGKPAYVDIAEGESMHLEVLRKREPVRGRLMRVGPLKKEVLVNAAPIIVEGNLRGSVAVAHDISEIKSLTEELEQVKRLVRRLEVKYSFDDIIGHSRGMLEAIEYAKRAAVTPATILLRGESGTGKELFAHAIHHASARRNKQLIRVNCAAIADSLLESELFGYEEGAFTGARTGGKKGLFEEAHGGTIFLDEISELSMGLQAKLLRVLQEREIIRVGGTKPISIDVRIIAATNVNLEEAIKRGTFREDLYYRISVVPIFIPPLRERKEDLPHLVHALIRRFNQQFGRCVHNISPEALEALLAYDWPGNVRELENVLERALINMRNNEEVILQEHLPLLDSLSPVTGLPRQISQQVREKGRERTLDEIIAEAEKNAIIEMLEKTKGNKTEAARRLGIATRSLYYKLERYGLS